MLRILSMFEDCLDGRRFSRMAREAMMAQDGRQEGSGATVGCAATGAKR